MIEYFTSTHKKILEALLNGERSRAEILFEVFGELENRRTTIYDNLVILQSRKLVEKFRKSDGTHGRPPTLWKLTELGKYKIKELMS